MTSRWTQGWNQNGRLDRLGMMVAGLCMVHCLATTVVIALLASAGGALLNPAIHEIGLGIAIVLGMATIGFDAMRHGYLMPVAIGSLGVGVMAGALTLPHGTMEIVYTILGVAILALGHDLNYRARH